MAQGTQAYAQAYAQVVGPVEALAHAAATVLLSAPYIAITTSVVELMCSEFGPWEWLTSGARPAYAPHCDMTVEAVMAELGVIAQAETAEQRQNAHYHLLGAVVRLVCLAEMTGDETFEVTGWGLYAEGSTEETLQALQTAVGITPETLLAIGGRFTYEISGRDFEIQVFDSAEMTNLQIDPEDYGTATILFVRFLFEDRGSWIFPVHSFDGRLPLIPRRAVFIGLPFAYVITAFDHGGLPLVS